MKFKYIYTGLAALAAAALFSCTKEMEGVYDDAPEREFMTMFRKEHNTAKSNDPYACTVENLNDIHLYWYGVDGCAGYEIKMALQPNVSSGLASDWENPANILFDTIVKPDVLDLVIKHLNYSTSYRFAIRTLSKKGAEYHSKWYGYGNGRQWADWFGLDTEIATTPRTCSRWAASPRPVSGSTSIWITPAPEIPAPTRSTSRWVMTAGS